MRHPWVNTLLLILMVAQSITGVVGLINGSEIFRWVLWLHAIGGYTVVVLLLWKAVVIIDSYVRRYQPLLPRSAFALLTGLLLFIIATGLLWIFGGRASFLGFSLMTIHALLSIVLLVLLIWHTLSLRYVFRIPAAVDRRAFLRLAGSSLSGFILWRFVELGLERFDLAGRARRFTGSYETGSLTGHFPTVSWIVDNPPRVDLNKWRLVIDGDVERTLSLDYDQLLELSTERVQATIDCTGGWYSVQMWQGVNVARLLEMAGVRFGARSLTVEAVSGYWRRFSLSHAQAGRYLLATHVADRPLIHGHGFPARWVALDHRGFDWVKWLSRIHVSAVSAAWQPPLPLQ